ncbi:hypothetical protein AVEN_71057-1 [Araneus ventricosus]|uniref:Uncharacterized protein n=1 Tax=Araneus ventricosus TaxID=182803 RepID=A0A4Y2WVQ4_ARAVE|nr:hypothetical protein AVEN_71057-1 [Araneus ventricosus]
MAPSVFEKEKQNRRRKNRKGRESNHLSTKYPCNSDSVLKIGLRVERRHYQQSVCLQDVVLVDQTDEKSSCSVLQHPPYSPDIAPSDDDEMMTTFNTMFYCG